MKFTSRPHLYEFGPFRLNPQKRLLLREDKPVPLSPKAFDTLLVLLQSSGKVVLKDDLMKAVWPGSFVEEANLSQNIFTVRKVLGDSPEQRRYIATVPGQGYQFTETVRVVAGEVQDDLVVESHSRTHVVIETESHSGQGEATTDTDEDELVFASRSRSRIVIETTATRSKFVLWILGALILGVSAVLLFTYRDLILRHSIAGQNELTGWNLNRLTSFGDCYDAVISPNGKFVAYVRDNGGAQSLWLRQIATGGDSSLISSTETRYWGLTFSPDGEYIYYVASQYSTEARRQDASLYRIPFFPGSEVKH